jgi:hypothetical protein
MKRYTCPCCGYRVFGGPPGTEERCPVCGWLDDMMHLRFPAYGGLPNGVSLADAQTNFALVGFPSSDFERDRDWRPLDLDVDRIEEPPADFEGLAEPEDPTALYYWMPERG